MINRDKIIQLKTHWFKGSNRILELGLPLASIDLYTFLVSQGDDYHPSVRLIAKKLGVNKSTVTKHIELLETCLVIRQVSSGSFSGSITARYEFLPPKGYRVMTKIAKVINSSTDVSLKPA